jgi:hypothetical protein
MEARVFKPFTDKKNKTIRQRSHYLQYKLLSYMRYFNVYTLVYTSDGHTFVYSLHRYRYRYIVSNDRYKQTPSVICL